MGKLRHILSTLLITAAIWSTCALAQNNLTQIRDTIYNSDGTPFNGTVVITWNGYSTTVSGSISPLSTSARIYNGALSVLLVPTTTAAAGSYYQVVYSSSDGTTMWTETWQVPPTSNALSVAGVRTSTGSGSSSGTGSGTGSGSGSGSGSGTGSTQYATLPIAMNQVTGLSAALNAITNSAAALTTSVSTLTTNETADSAAITSLNNRVTTLSNAITNGSSGSSGSVSTAFIDGEVPAGTTDGSNVTFTLSASPTPAGSLELYRNGLVQASGVDYTISGSTITFLPADVPHTGDVVQAYYRVTGTTSPVPNFSDNEVPGGAINGSNSVFTLASAPTPLVSLKLYKNGMLLQQHGDYTISGATITFVTSVAPQAGDAIVAYYRH